MGMKLGLHNQHHLYSSPKYYWCYQIKVEELGGTCGMHGREDKCIQDFGRTT